MLKTASIFSFKSSKAHQCVTFVKKSDKKLQNKYSNLQWINCLVELCVIRLYKNRNLYYF